MSSISVLVVDDDQFILDLVREYLETNTRYILDTVSSAQDVIEKLKHFPYDVIVSDYSMPEMNGLELLQQIRLFSHTPFILMTGTDNTKIVIDAINLGVDYYLKKGDDTNLLFTELIHMIESGVQRKRASDIIQENLSNFEKRFELSPTPTIISSSDGKIYKINPASISLFGLSYPESLNEIPFFEEVIGEDAIKRIQSGDTFSISSQVNFAQVNERYPGIFDRTDTIYFDISFVPTTTLKGEISEYVIQIIDFTEEYLAKEELKKTGEQLSLALDGSRLGLWDWKIQTGEVTNNKRWAEIIGYSLEELNSVTGQTWMNLTHPKDLEISHQLLQKHFSGEIPFYECEIRMRHKNGHWVWIQDRGRVVEWDPEGKPIRMAGTYADITDRKINEDHLRRQKNILYEISYTATHLMSSLSDDSISVVLSKVGKAVGVSRTALYTHFYDEDGTSCIRLNHEWTEEGNVPQITNQILQDFDWKNNGFARWANILMNRGIIYGSVIDLPEIEQPFFLNLSVKSLAAVPIFSLDDFLGFISFDYNNDHEWLDFELEALEIAAGLLGATLGRQKAEDEVKSREANLSTFFNTIEDFLFVLDTEGNILKVNDTVIHRLGYLEEELIGHSVLKVHPERRRQEAYTLVDDILAGRCDFCPVPLISKNGIQIPVETRVISGLWNDKPALFGVSKDISEITLSEEKFSKAFHSSGSLMAISILESGEFIDVNQSFIDTLGYSREEIVGKRSTKIGFYVDTDIRQKIIDDIKKTGLSRHSQLKLKKKDGNVLTGIFSANLINIQNTEMILTVLDDITEVVQLTDALLQANNKLHLLSSITRHDILNQVQALFFIQELMKQEILPEDKLFIQLEMLEKAVDTIYHQILFTKDYQDLGTHAAEWILIESIINKVKGDKLFSSIEIDVNTGDLEIFLDPMFSKVCFNLFENAIRHGEHVTHISVYFHTLENNGVLVFEDDGIGVSQADKDKIFNQGFGKNSGFGLFLTKEIISITGIAIRETGIEGKGARFELVIPPNGFRMRP